jgi:catechol 2,3-dioxygenase-like lactoylglutathione lyase family enzyme
MTTVRRSIGMIPAKDYQRAKSWYADKLGLKPVEEMENDMGSYYEVGDSTFLLYPSEFAGTNKANQIAFEVDDVEATVKDLRSAGVEFMEFEMPDFEFVDGVVTMEVSGRVLKSAFCTDSEDNILVIGNAWRD